VKDELYAKAEVYAKDVMDVLEKLKACIKRLQVTFPQKSALQYRVEKRHRML